MNDKIVSYPKDKVKILLLENIHPLGIEVIKNAGYTNLVTLDRALTNEELIDTMDDVKLLGIRSKTQITSEIIKRFSSKLLGIGCFCIGTNQVDKQEANKQGIAVFNSPYSNTRSVAELVIGLSIMLFRRIFDKSTTMHHGKWQKTAQQSHEVRAKVLGLIGYGNIGSQVSVLAEAMGMQVYFYDVAMKLPIGNARPTKTLEELLKLADVVSLHVPSTDSTKNMMSTKQFKQMKRGAFLINYARGEVVNVDDLAQAIKDGHLGGGAIDVFPEEPENNTIPFKSILQSLPNVILTPHIGGSTIEAQEQISLDVAHKLINFLEAGNTSDSKTLPEIDINIQKGSHRILHIHKNVPGIISRISNILFENNININSQSLKSNQEIGYAIFDVDAKLSREAYKLLSTIPDTVKTRLLY